MHDRANIWREALIRWIEVGLSPGNNRLRWVYASSEPRRRRQRCVCACACVGLGMLGVRVCVCRWVCVCEYNIDACRKVSIAAASTEHSLCPPSPPICSLITLVAAALLKPDSYINLRPVWARDEETGKVWDHQLHLGSIVQLSPETNGHWSKYDPRKQLYIYI